MIHKGNLLIFPDAWDEPQLSAAEELRAEQEQAERDDAEQTELEEAA